MAFNSDTYHRNKARRLSATYMAQAREIKARMARGEAYDWEAARLASLVQSAKLYRRLARTVYRGRG